MSELLSHAFKPNPWPGHDICDAMVDDGDRVRTCCQPEAAHQQAPVAEPAAPVQPNALQLALAAAAGFCPGVYLHFKTQKNYVADKIQFDRSNDNDGMPYVHYWSLANGPADEHLRRADEFFSMVEIPFGLNTVKARRFQRVA